MKFNKIVLKNFRQFKGETELVFSTDKKNNVTVIYGGITHGKTTLLQAFNWALYGKANLQNPQDLLNYELVAEMRPGDTATVSVEIYLTADKGETEYRFERIQNYIMAAEHKPIPTSSFSKAERRENDTWILCPNFEEEVNKIIPHSLSTYFFFDGERMDVISREQRQGSQEVGNSVKSILGLEHFNTALKHLKGTVGSRHSVISELTNKYNDTAGSEIKDIKNSIEELKKRIDSNRESIDRYQTEIEKLEISKKAKEKIIEANKGTKEKQEQKNELQRRIKRLEQNQDAYFDSYVSFFNHYYLDFFYIGLKDKLDKLYETDLLDQKTEAVPNMHQKSIEYILKRGYCICGEKFEKDDEHYKALMDEMKKLPPQSIGTSIATFKKDAVNNISQDKANNFKQELMNKYATITENGHEINVLRDNVEIISNDIQTDIDVGMVEQQVREIEYKIKLNSENIGKLIAGCESMESQLDSKEKELSKKAQFDEKNKEIDTQVNYARHIVDIIEKYYAIREKELIEKLEENINKYLQQIYTGKRKMKITSDYKFKLLFEDKDVGDSPESEGLGTVKAISFMCGLLDVAKSKIVDDENAETMYPLVFDAPLSKLDSVHRTNVMSCLPNVASQVIIFTREKNDLMDITPETRTKISKEYFIQKNSEKYSKVVLDRRVN